MVDLHTKDACIDDLDLKVRHYHEEAQKLEQQQLAGPVEGLQMSLKEEVEQLREENAKLRRRVKTLHRTAEVFYLENSC